MKCDEEAVAELAFEKVRACLQHGNTLLEHLLHVDVVQLCPTGRLRVTTGARDTGGATVSVPKAPQGQTLQIIGVSLGKVANHNTRALLDFGSNQVFFGRVDNETP